MKYDHTTKSYMHKPESILKNEIFLDFKIQTDHLFVAKKLEKLRKYLDFAKKKTKQKKRTMEYKGDGDTNFSWSTRYNLKEP